MSFQLQPESFFPKNLNRLTNGLNWQREGAAILLLFVFWTGAIALVNPIGDFPLNDDFSYGKSVQNLAVEGQFLLDTWLAQTLAAQVFWGAAWCEVFGFSFTTLRFSTLFLGFVGIVASYFLCRELGLRKRLAILFALTVAFNPLFFSLSFTFMTDVPFFTFSILSTLFYCKALRLHPGASLSCCTTILLATFFALAATFVRQIGLMLPLAFAVVWLCRGGIRLKSSLVALLPAAMVLAAFISYNHWLEQWQGLPTGYGNFTRLIQTFESPGIASRILPRTGILLAYLGAFFVPLILALALAIPASQLKIKRSAPGFAKACIVLFLFTACVFAWRKLPWANVIYNFGLGPKLLKDGQFFINISPVLPENALTILKLAASASGLLLAVLLLARLGFWMRTISVKVSENPGPHWVFVIFASVNLALYLGFLLVDKHFFDRYFLQLVPFLGLWLFAGVSERKVKIFPAASISLLAIAIFSVAATHDYLAWNRARWDALHFLTDKMKISPSHIDGGFEFNGWYKPGEREYGRRKSWWWVDRDDYVVTFGNLEGYTKMKSYVYKRWLPPGTDSLFLLKKQ